MPDQIGVSFQPGTEDDNGQQRAEPLQEAVRLLNLRLPSVLGARSPVHPSLLQASGLQGQPDAQFLNTLRMLGIAPGGGRLGPNMPQAGVPPLSGFPQPNVTVEKPIPGNPPGGPSSLMPLPSPPQQPSGPPESRSGQGAFRPVPRISIDDPRRGGIF